MSQETILQDLYPNILSLTYQQVENYGRKHPEHYLDLLNICHDLYRERKHNKFEGWVYEANPFEQMNFDQPMPPSFTSVMQTQSEMTLNGNRWLGIGVWKLAEEYYKIAIRLCIVTNDTVAALQNGANLALCYLAAGDCNNALKLCEHLTNVSIDYSTDVVRQIGTIVRWCYIKTKQEYFASQHTAWLLEVTPKFASLDLSIFNIINDVWKVVGDHRNAQKWRTEWNQLQELVHSFETYNTSYNYEERFGIAAQRKVKFVLPREKKPGGADYLDLIDDESEQFTQLQNRTWGIFGQYVQKFGEITTEEFINRLGEDHPFSPDQIDKIRSVMLHSFFTGIRFFVSVAVLHNLDIPFKPNLEFDKILKIFYEDEERCTELDNRYEVNHSINSVGDYIFVFQFYQPEMDTLPFGYVDLVRRQILSCVDQAYILCMIANDFDSPAN